MYVRMSVCMHVRMSVGMWQLWVGMYVCRSTTFNVCSRHLDNKIYFSRPSWSHLRLLFKRFSTFQCHPIEVFTSPSHHLPSSGFRIPVIYDLSNKTQQIYQKWPRTIGKTSLTFEI